MASLIEPAAGGVGRGIGLNQTQPLAPPAEAVAHLVSQAPALIAARLVAGIATTEVAVTEQDLLAFRQCIVRPVERPRNHPLPVAPQLVALQSAKAQPLEV
ncbi:hypothetical protein D3C78_1181000 [compost metagenome]